MTSNAWARYENERNAAHNLMKHYLQNSFNFKWEGDNAVEAMVLVDAIIDAAVWRVIHHLQESADKILPTPEPILPLCERR